MSNKADFAKHLTDPDAIATVLLVGLLDEFGTEMFDWEPDTLNLEIESVWKVCAPQVNRDKIWALITTITTNAFTRELDGFTHICNALNGSGASFQTYDPATVQEMAWAIAEVTLVDPLESPFGPEIVAYMQARLSLEAFDKPPRMLAKFVPPMESDEAINANLEADGIMVKSYWDNQLLKRIEVDSYVVERLARLIGEVTALPLAAADPKALQDLKQRAKTTLVRQGQEIQAARESVPARPAL